MADKCPTCDGHGIVFPNPNSDFYDNCPDCDGHDWPQSKADALEIVKEMSLREREACAIVTETIVEATLRYQPGYTLRALAKLFRTVG